jgi:hypothetical protein
MESSFSNLRDASQLTIASSQGVMRRRGGRHVTDRRLGAAHMGAVCGDCQAQIVSYL